jgi:transcriptional regulator with XRE-family HTH domain
MAELRRQGLSLSEIGRRFGVTKQAVHWALGPLRHRPIPSVRCTGCGRPFVSAGALPDNGAAALCLPCLRRRPRATFGQRLRAYRMAAGLTRAELARRVGVSETAVHSCERDKGTPRPGTLAKLARVLGQELLG